MKCIKCGNPLRIIKGGMKTELYSTKITMVHVWGCTNPDCDKKLEEVKRTETESERFEE